MPIFRDDESRPFWDAVGAIEDEKLHDTLYEYGCKAQTLEHQLEKLRGDSDFRSHTCGECAWAIEDYSAKSVGCRYCVGMSITEDGWWEPTAFAMKAACPAFVPREEPKP